MLPSIQAYNGNTALHITSSLQGRKEQVNAVRLLMRKGADPSAKNLENEQPAHLVPEGERGDQVGHDVNTTYKGYSKQMTHDLCCFAGGIQRCLMIYN